MLSANPLGTFRNSYNVAAHTRYLSRVHHSFDICQNGLHFSVQSVTKLVDRLSRNWNLTSHCLLFNVVRINCNLFRTGINKNLANIIQIYVYKLSVEHFDVTYCRSTVLLSGSFKGVLLKISKLFPCTIHVDGDFIQ